ncbi:LRR receptor-like serine/threonine-protein kinase GSO2 [Olea europaea var. sylvestris]|uniref:LRR receptor-like serine/threonine-protein kinase GSO2 n=1 Tax=Olea europaea var. sylvestris TaxID=158386 RepID=UPI000C1D2BCF|nr:LRR receptor-like serine/threonine-protein kinase GSO2 [Olea europaea var. sylvestris]
MVIYPTLKEKLDYNYFRSNLPQELVQLQRLRTLSQVQYFTGFTPPSLSNISTLHTLNLSFNPLQTKIPGEIGNLNNLRILNLEYDNLSGLLLIFNGSKIETLALSDNSLSGTLPLDICRRLPKLEGLHRSSNLLDGEIPANISECSQLDLLSLSYNKFSGSVE